MSEREGFEAQQEAKRETLGPVSRSTRERIWDGLTKYLAAEARYARKETAPEKEKPERRDRRSS